MVRFILVSTAGFYLAASTNLRAQATPPHSDLSTARYDRSDTLRAVQHLFMQRSKATRGWLQAGVGLTAAAVTEKTVLTASGVRKIDKRYYQSRQQDANGNLMMGTLMTGYGVFRLSRFGPQQYQRVVEAYAQDGSLPRYLTHRLKPKYFRLLPL
ncbi:hypothetical protein ACFPAF_07820 [Hymenobacter endophyticus]|uniref:Uncharacterized protein n=1 Tax=Hymenobacter endophyticus TaxID=3076335 RepID=A0ABU3TG03_9BACT|nr:hypothetical protein [Hymenobacter endophyticus]MDU0370293.1 hypothetical protein [Hymenobacter endophyticus]